MMVLRGVVVVAALTCVAGQTSKPEPQRCCFDRRFRTMNTQAKTLHSDRIDTLELAFDFDRQIQGTRVHSFDPVTRTSKVTALVILDSHKLMTYVVPTADPSQCIKTPMAYPMITGARCVPDDATFLGTYYWGPGNQIEYNLWRMTKPGFSNMTITIAFTTADCRPIMDTGVYDPSTVPTENVFLWWDYEPEVRDMSIFDLPPSCRDHDTPVGK